MPAIFYRLKVGLIVTHARMLWLRRGSLFRVLLRGTYGTCGVIHSLMGRIYYSYYGLVDRSPSFVLLLPWWSLTYKLRCFSVGHWSCNQCPGRDSPARWIGFISFTLFGLPHRGRESPLTYICFTMNQLAPSSFGISPLIINLPWSLQRSFGRPIRLFMIGSLGFGVVVPHYVVSTGCALHRTTSCWPLMQKVFYTVFFCLGHDQL